MNNIYRFALILFFYSSTGLGAQSGCPGCIIALPQLPDDTVFLSEASVGFLNIDYDTDISFRFPKTTTPVYAIDSTTIPGISIDKFKITNLSNLPPGLTWEANATEFDTSTGTDGCAKICGTPTETGLFYVSVELDAFVFGIASSTSFDFPITIYPTPRDSVPIELFGNYGCGPTTITFFNNIQSNGLPGFEYIWDFGDLTISQEEFPDPKTYSEPGTYPIFYRAKVDTAGYKLNRVTVTSTECDDFSFPPFTDGDPDLYLQFESTSGDLILKTPVKKNAEVPVHFDLNLPLNLDSIRLKVYDEDGALAGADDLCGEIMLNQNSSGVQKDGSDLEVNISVFHPIEVIDFYDTVVVYEAPPIPVISPEDITVNCLDTLELTVVPGGNIEWFFEGNFYDNKPSIRPDMPGKYWATYTAPGSGCSATSDTVAVPELVYPETPIFESEQNWLTVIDSVELPNDFSLQWYLDGVALSGENTDKLCAKIDGVYTLIVTDIATGCKSEYEVDIVIDPQTDCTLSNVQMTNYELVRNIFPNPTSGLLTIVFSTNNFGPKEIDVYSVAGQQVLYKQVTAGNSEQLDLSSFVQGIYILKVTTKNNVFSSKIIKR